MYLGVDLGTTNVKSLVVEDDGRIVGVGSSPVDRWCTADGGVEQDIEQIWSATCVAIRQAVGAIDPAGVRAIGVSSQGGSLQCLDGQHQPLGRVISWLDQRGRADDLHLVSRLGTEFLSEHIGHGASAMTIGQVLRLRRQSPERLGPPNCLGFVGDVIVARLCGRRAHDATSLGIAMLYNPWLNRADPEILAALGLRDRQLPDLLPATTPAGPLRAEVAGKLGLPPGIPVSPAVHDQYAAALGAGAVQVGDVNFGAGTAWVLLANTDRLARPIVPNAFVGTHPVAGLYGQMLSLTNGGSAIEWVMRLVGRDRSNLAQVDDLMETVAPGSDGLRFWPLLVAGSEQDSNHRPGGRVEGITLAHQPAHLMRAVVEGLACELARHLGFLTAAGFASTQLSMCGSAATSRLTPQIVADVTGLPVACIDVADVSAFGAATIACALAGGRRGLAEIARQWSPASRIVAPGAQRPVYRALLDDYLASFAA